MTLVIQVDGKKKGNAIIPSDSNQETLIKECAAVLAAKNILVESSRPKIVSKEGRPHLINFISN